MSSLWREDSFDEETLNELNKQFEQTRFDSDEITAAEKDILSSERNKEIRDNTIKRIVKRTFRTEGLAPVFETDAEKKIRKMIVNKWTVHQVKTPMGTMKGVPISQFDIQMAQKIYEFRYASSSELNNITIMKMADLLPAILLMLYNYSISDYERLVLKMFMWNENDAIHATADFNKDPNRLIKMLRPTKNLIDQTKLVISFILRLTESDIRYYESENRRMLSIVDENLSTFKENIHKTDVSEVRVLIYNCEDGTIKSEPLRKCETLMTNFYQYQDDWIDSQGQVQKIRPRVKCIFNGKTWLTLAIFLGLLCSAFGQNPAMRKVDTHFSQNMDEYRDKYYTSKSDIYRDKNLMIYAYNGFELNNFKFSETVNYTFGSECLGMKYVNKVLRLGEDNIQIERGCKDDECLNYNCETCSNTNCEKMTRTLDDLICNDITNEQREKINNRGLSKFGRNIMTEVPFPNDFEICKVDGETLRPCKNSIEVKGFYYLSYNWDGTRSYFLDVGLSAWFDVESQSSYYCLDNNKEKCNRTNYNGDDTYCSYFQCSSWSDCYCRPNMTSGIVTIQSTTESKKYVPKCLSYSYGNLVLEDPLIDIIKHDILNNGSKILVEPTLTQDKCDLNLNFLGRTMKLIIVKASPEERYMLTESKDNYKFTLDKEACVNDKLILVSLAFEPLGDPYDNWEIVHSFISPGNCALITCYWCYDYWFFVNCWSGYYWIINVLMVLIVIIIIFYFFKSMYMFTKILYMTGCFIRMILRTLIKVLRMGGKMIKMNKPNIRGTEDLSMIESNSDLVNTIGADRQSNNTNESNKKNKNKSGFYSLSLTIIMVFFNLISGGLCCSQFSSISANNNQCTINQEGVTKCTYAQVVDFNIAPYGQESCMLFKDNKNVPLGTLKIVTIDVRMKCSYALNYYVPQAEIKCESVHMCDSVGLCSGSKCAGVTQSNYDTYFPSATTHLGWGQCFGVCGCAGCGCFLCGGACLLGYKYFTSTSNKWFEVGSCTNWNYEVDIEYWIEYIDKSGASATTPRTKITINPTNSVTMSLLGSVAIIKLNSVSVPPIDMLNNCVIRDPVSDLYSMAPCNKAGEFAIGRIGEIQCPDPSSAQIIKTTCTGQESLITMTSSGSHSVGCIGSVLDITKVWKENKLPKASQGVTFLQSGGDVVASVQQISLYGARITTTGLTFESLVEDNKCSVSFESLTGCYKCAAGASLKVSGYTDFGSTSTHITCSKSGIDTWLSMNSTNQNFMVIVNSKLQNVNEDCKVFCNNHEMNLRIQGNLITVTNPDDLITEESNNENFVVTLTKSWWGILLISAVSLVVFILILALVFCLVLTIMKNLPSKRKVS